MKYNRRHVHELESSRVKRGAFLPILRIFLLIGPVFAAGVAFSAVQNRQCESVFRSSTAESWRATFTSGSVEVDGRTVYYESRRAKRGKPTIILFVGIYTPLVEHLAAFQKSFAEQADGEGLLIFAYSTALESVLAGSKIKPDTFDKNLPVTTLDFVRQATGVVNAAGVRGPAVAVGYSFGSIAAGEFAAFHKGRVTDLVLVAPFVTQGEHSEAVLIAKSNAEALVFYNPIFGPAMLEAIRARAAKETVKMWFDDPSLALTANPIVAHLGRQISTQAIVAQIRTLDEADLRHADMAAWPRTHFLLAGQDNPMRLTLQKEAVEILSETAQDNPDVQGIARTLKKSTHTVLAAQPDSAVRHILRIARRRR